MKYFPVKFEKIGDDYFAIMVENSIESENSEDVYDWISEYEANSFNLERLMNMTIDEMIENEPDDYHVFSENSIGYVVIKSYDIGVDSYYEFGSEEEMKEILTDWYGEEVVNELLKDGYYFDDSEYTADEIDDGTWSLTLKKVILKK